jgi:Putative translation initiation inhibitor, yjgF family
MNYWLQKYSDVGVDAEITGLIPRGKVHEFQVMLHVFPNERSFFRQLQNLSKGLSSLINEAFFDGAQPVFARCFLSDASNQYEQALQTIDSLLNCPVSYVQQPPLDGSKIAIWLQLETNVLYPDELTDGYEHNGYVHYYSVFNSSFLGKTESSYTQTHLLLNAYERKLDLAGCSIGDNCLRTWFFARDIDCDYRGVVEARKENFQINGLTKDSHYIASTGIQGGAADYRTKVLMDAYAIQGVEKEQICHLYALGNMSPTYEYGVTFERGVSVDFGDRRRVLISGTASIDNNGKILHEGDIEKQVSRMLDNVQALLHEADCDFNDLMQIIVYLRDMADYQNVKKRFDEQFSQVPKAIVYAPICRPGWLVEMECIAVKEVQNPQFRDL